jgi:putative ubiquitin-RnfH superfamily antitoxin RatB of RatAB toxin-antitoxin module
MAPERSLRIEVVWAQRERQTLIALAVPPGTTAGGAVEQSGIRARHPEIPSQAPIGIHGRVVAASCELADGDRVEIYRPLPADPKETRRRLAREGRTMGRRR